MSLAMPQPAYAYDKPPPTATTTDDPTTTHNPYNSYNHNHDPNAISGANHAAAARDITRTPSPTSSEIDLLNGVRKPRSLKTKIRFGLTLLLIALVIILVEAFHDKIVNALIPVTRWLHQTRAGWLIPIVVLIALSFPPLFGHELVAMLCGLVWGLGAGFGIVAAGTLLGEICTYFFFKHLCGARGRRLELSNVPYGTLAHIVREGGLPIAILVRYSSFPAHFTTAVFSTCGMAFWVFFVAAVVSLPKQLVLVYIGVALASDDSKSNKIQHIVLGVTIVVTVLFMLYIRRLMKRAQPAVVYARRKARQAEMNSTASATPSPNQSPVLDGEEERRKVEVEGQV
ncbi:hypothetical protein DFH08DRAFT_1088423 [Mycena albidolilacea]|uniref:Golgi apparatus membrane protein TVP38 n=1 Tax=Mycena albidolilacea TaxID=1033008 RepID=A0AAD7EBS8_9AGAR|nr:hypothetical protein DFH08DRAFT_1090613 [Mycena albidolilacea]KAJ7308776.1 hypothetical protein DFH08DRAFT_1088423 [Mycena albidolilacea]